MLFGLLYGLFDSKIRKDNSEAEKGMSESHFTMQLHRRWRTFGFAIIIIALFYMARNVVEFLVPLWSAYGTGERGREDYIIVFILFSSLAALILGTGIYLVLWQSRYRLIVKDDEITMYWLWKEPIIYQFSDITRAKKKSSGDIVLYHNKVNMFDVSPYMTGYSFFVNRLEQLNLISR